MHDDEKLDNLRKMFPDGCVVIYIKNGCEKFFYHDGGNQNSLIQKYINALRRPI